MGGGGKLISYILSTTENPDDRAFLKALYQDYERLMFSTVRKYISSLPDQKDVVQDSVEKLMKKVSLLRALARCSLANYIVYTIRSTSIDFLRVQQRNAGRYVSIDEPEFSELETTEPPLEKSMILVERLVELEKVWPDLPEEDRMLLEGKYILGYKDEELATKLKCKPSSIRMKLTRARRRALERLADKEEV